MGEVKKTEKPWGFEELWANTDKYSAKKITIYPNSRMSLQFHEKKEETIYVCKGTLRIWTSDDDDLFVDLKEGSVFHVEPKSVHRFGSAGDKQIEIMEVSTSELNDVVRLKDDYGR